MGRNVQVSNRGLPETIQVNNSIENFSKKHFDVITGKKSAQDALLEIKDEQKIPQEVK